MKKILKELNNWSAPECNGIYIYGDMPGDKIEINESHIEKAKILFPRLLELMKESVDRGASKIVVSVCGGSGVGKSETASLISTYLTKIGIGAYTLSGDNYPNRIPMYNDAERLRLFRQTGILQMVEDGVYTRERFAVVKEMQEKELDADVKLVQEYPWYASYLTGGKKGLCSYLGTPNEIGFSVLNQIIDEFKSEKEQIYLKRMGRDMTEYWFDSIDFSNIQVLVIEWTHGNNDNLVGVDIPILLNSTPEETLAHRKARNRDGGVDSPFVTTVLGIEQDLLASQAKKAKIIVSKSGELIDFDQIMENSRNLSY